MSKTATPHLPFLADPSSAPRLPKTESSQIYDSSRQRPRQSDSVRLGGCLFYPLKRTLRRAPCRSALGPDADIASFEYLISLSEHGFWSTSTPMRFRPWLGTDQAGSK